MSMILMPDAPIIRSKADYAQFVRSTMTAINFAIGYHRSCVTQLILLKRLNGGICDDCDSHRFGVCIANDSLFSYLR